MTRQELREDLEIVVRKVMREEFREILAEAVEIASRPEAKVVAEAPSQHMDFPVPDWVVKLDRERTAPKPVVENMSAGTGNPVIMGLLGATAKGMTGADLSNYS